MKTYIVVRQWPYYVVDESLPKARARFKRLTGKFPTKKANMITLTGTLEQLDEITVDDMGTVHYPKGVVKAEIQ